MFCRLHCPHAWVWEVLPLMLDVLVQYVKCRQAASFIRLPLFAKESLLVLAATWLYSATYPAAYSLYCLSYSLSDRSKYLKPLMLLLTLGKRLVTNFFHTYGLPLISAQTNILSCLPIRTSRPVIPFPIQTLLGILHPHAFLAAYFTVRSACLLACLPACIFYSFLPPGLPLPSHLCLPPGRHTSQLSLPTSRPAISQSSLPASRWAYFLVISTYIPACHFTSNLCLPLPNLLCLPLRLTLLMISACFQHVYF